MAKRMAVRSKSRGPGGIVSAAPSAGVRGGRAANARPSAASLTSKPSTTSIGSALQDQDWFHGLLPREDILKMLVNQGDFLVRKTEVDGVVKHVLSVYWDNKARHVVLNTNDTATRHYIDPTERDFASITELVTYYRGRSMTLPRSDYRLMSPVPRQEWELRHEQITLGKKLGEGAFGEVFKATLLTRDGVQIAVAVKQSHTGRDMSKEEIAEIVAESRIMQKFKHDHLVHLYGVAAETQPIMLVLELVTGGGLDSYLQKNSVSPAMKVKFCVDAAKGVEYLHFQKCIHRDLACRNCLLSGDNMVKISDFGLSQEGTSFKMKASSKVPIRWLAPETISTMTYTLMTDVWAFGILMWEIFHNGTEPYPGMKVPEVAAQVKHGYKMEVAGDPLIPFGAKQIVTAVWITDPSQRPKMGDVRLKLEELRKQMG